MSPSEEWDAGQYHAVSDPQVRWGMRVLERLALQGGEKVLDAGCGTGRLTRILLDRLPRGAIVAVDQSENMLEVARQTLSDDPRVEFVRADLAHLKLSQPVDAVFSTATFHWVLDHDALFAALARTLKPGGRLVAQCGGGPNLARLYGRARTMAAEAPYAKHFEGWTQPLFFAGEANTASRLKSAGFTDIKVWLHEEPTSFEDADAFKTFLSTVVLRAHLEQLPSFLRPSFLDSLTETAGRDLPPWTLDYWRLNLEARRL